MSHGINDGRNPPRNSRESKSSVIYDQAARLSNRDEGSVLQSDGCSADCDQAFAVLGSFHFSLYLRTAP